MHDQDLFDLTLVEIMNRHPASTLLSVPGIYEIVAEELNNEVLDAMNVGGPS